MIPEAAIEAAARAVFAFAYDAHCYGSEPHATIPVVPDHAGSRAEGMEWFHNEARAALEAAMPAIREALAQEIEAEAKKWLPNSISRHRFDQAARIVRGV